MKKDMVLATRLSLANRGRAVFTDVTFSVDQGCLVAITGPAGSGRSSLLLAIGGRMRGLTGTLQVAGHDAGNQSRHIRRCVSLARIGRLVDVEGQLTVADSITERALTDAVPTARAGEAFRRAEDLLDLTFERRALVDDLPALDRTLLAVALATLRPAQVVLLDDAGAALDLADHRLLMAALLRLTESNVTVVASTLDTEALPPSAATYALPARS